MLIEDFIENPKDIIDKIELLDKKTTEQNKPTIWQPWKDGEMNTFCYQKQLVGPDKIQEFHLFPECEIYLYNIINSITDKAKEVYCDKYTYAKSNLKGREQPNVLKYFPGGFLPLHQDHGVSSRALTILVYLNDDYEGGEISLPFCDVTIKPKAGSVLLFPSNFIYAHTVAEMKSGVRYAIPAWFHNRKEMHNSDGSE